jgi:hypothetical protein
MECIAIQVEGREPNLERRLCFLRSEILLAAAQPRQLVFLPVEAREVEFEVSRHHAVHRVASAIRGRGRGLQELGLDKLLLGVWRCRRL